MKLLIARPCGNPQCGVSSGIHCGDNYPGLTFGSGELDFNGYWDKPCSICARHHEFLYPEDGQCWPFAPANRMPWPQNIKTLDAIIQLRYRLDGKQFGSQLTLTGEVLRRSDQSVLRITGFTTDQHQAIKARKIR